MEIPWRSPLTWSVDQYILGEALGVDGEGCRSALDKFSGMRVLAIPIAKSPDMSDGCCFFILRFSVIQLNSTIQKTEFDTSLFEFD